MAEQQKKIDVRKLVARLHQESNTVLQRELIAPLLPGGKIRTCLSGMVHEFTLRGEFVGWGCFQPLNEREAELVREALPWERGSYLELFPLLRVILLWPDTTTRFPGTWWALPYNESDARQRFGFAAEPRPIFLCDPTNGAEQFERVLVRVNGGTLWYDGPDPLADPVNAEWLRDAATHNDGTNSFLSGLASSERMALLLWQIRQLEQLRPELRRQEQERAQQRHLRYQQQQEWLRQQVERGQLEERLRHALAKADATLHSYRELPTNDGSPGQLIVEWSEQGETRRYRSTLDPRLTVVSSGICLSGQDRNFDLTSLVSVMSDSPW